jgi:hypothetical protein
MAAMKRKVHERTPIADDLEVHISTIKSAGQTFYEIRQYIPSLKQYGRGITVPAAAPRASADIIAGLIAARKEHAR